jgi:2-oxoglutarate ferredoxin oxidoreductase subunit gamma
MSQDAYEKYEPELRADGILIYDTDLVKLRPARGRVQLYGVPSTRFAEEMGNRIFANLVMLGFFTAITKVVSPEAMKKALPGLVPKRFLDLNIQAFQRGYDYGIEILGRRPVEPEKPDAAREPSEIPPEKPRKTTSPKAKQ